MLYTTAAILYGALSITLGSTTRNSLSIVLLGIIVAVSIAHCFLGDVKSFRISFLIMVLSVFLRCLWLLSVRVPDKQVKKDVKYLALCGSG
jgi:hypothetical protein